MNLDELLITAADAARNAGDRLKSAQSEGPKILSDQGRDMKLQADRESEETILNALKQTPYPILAEESGEIGKIDTGQPAWVVDPLDGTFNYSRLQPLCCVSIALVEGNRTLLGVVYDFNRSDMYSAIPSLGKALLNGSPMKVSSATDRGQASLATGFPVNRDYSTESLQGMIGYFQNFKKIRMFGTAALSLAWVSCGKVDAYFEEDIMFWDVAAGLALVEAAGGYVDIRDSSPIGVGENRALRVFRLDLGNNLNREENGMIVDRIENWARYSKSRAWKKAFAFLQGLNADSEEAEALLEPDGSLLARVMSYPTRGPGECVLEAHRRFIDIQMTLANSEAIAWYPVEDLETKDPYDAEKDFEFFHPPKTEIARANVFPGTFVTLFPEDAHMPQLMTVESPETVKKVVIKMRLDLF